MRYLIIDRSKWRTGRFGDPHIDNEVLGKTSLLNKKGGRCCLGFLGQACGVAERNMLNVGLPSAIGGKDEDGWPSELFGEELLEMIISSINDKEGLNNKDREEKVFNIFMEKLDIHVTFVGKYHELRIRKPKPVRKYIGSLKDDFRLW